MATLVVGASGATGRLLVKQLLDRGEKVTAIVRSTSELPAELAPHDCLTLVTANILELSDAELAAHVKDCSAVASCLGHNLSFKGIFGQPRQLVTQATRKLCIAIRANRPEQPVRFVLMNTTGNRNRDLKERISFAQQCVIALLRGLVPPHRDNETAADYLRTQLGQDNRLVEWVAVRPDGLTDEATVTEYDLFPSPTRSAIFDAGKTSRINVGHFMADLIGDDSLWQKWKGQMPVIYNRSSAK